MTSVQRPHQDAESQKEELWQSVAQILEVLENEMKPVGLRNIIIAGMSQGCATGIFTLVTSGIRVGGFMGLCGWLPLVEELSLLMGVPGRERGVFEMPLLLQHCKDDEVVPVRNGETLKKKLEEWGGVVDWMCFEEGGHWLNEPGGMDGLVEFIQAVMRASPFPIPVKEEKKTEEKPKSRDW